MSKKCLKCGYIRQPGDPSPDYECPKCGVVYAKMEAAVAARLQAEKLQAEKIEAAKLEAEQKKAIELLSTASIPIKDQEGDRIQSEIEKKLCEQEDLENKFETKQCPFCKELVNKEATKCPHCRSFIFSDKNAIIKVGAVVLVLFCVYQVITWSSKREAVKDIATPDVQRSSSVSPFKVLSEEQKKKNERAERNKTTELEAKAATARELLDPSSVQFRNIIVALDADSPDLSNRHLTSRKADRVCGEFNAKNRLGGYVGFRWFYWDSGTLKAILASAGDSLSERHENETLKDVCTAIELVELTAR